MGNTTDNRSLNAAARAAKQHLPRYQQRRNPPAARIRSPRGSARRFNNLVAQFTAEIARDLTAVEAGMIRQAAAILLRCEQQQAAVVRGELASTDELIRLASEARRIIASLKRVAVVAEATGTPPWSPLRAALARSQQQAAVAAETEETS
jgi:hypothetical protein